MGAYAGNMREELERLSENAAGFRRDTALFQYIRWINEQIENKDETFLRDYLPIIQREKQLAKDKPFLTVLTRTQGKRPEMLREMLLSLDSQSDGDFELLLMEHMLTGPDKERLTSLIGELSPSLTGKLREIPVDCGNRTTPLNLGFAHARGSYVAVLDDDDIVFDNWVESFHQAAAEKPGTILHAYVLSQRWTALRDGESVALRAEAAPGTECCVDYKLLRQLDANLCPLNGLAFPSYYFQELGMIFDESLSTTEDWDYFMRLSFLAGVTDIRTPTAIYRLWTNADNSHTQHTKWEWNRNYQAIREKFIRIPILFPAGSDKFNSPADEAEVIRPERERKKEKWRKRIPKPIWLIMKKLYRFFGGKKWLG